MSTVLIVDDEQSILRALQRLLRPDGFQLRTVDTGAEAVELLRQEEIAVVVCDQRMPEMCGAEVLEEAYRLQPESVRITLTGFADFDSIQRSINHGHVSQLLVKPWDDSHLRMTIATAVKSYEDRREKERLERLVGEQKAELESLNSDLEERIEARTHELNRRCAELTEARKSLEHSLCDTVNVLTETLEAHSPNLGFHSKRVAELASRIALRMKLSASDLQIVEFAARLHELGRIAQPAVADKPSQDVDADLALEIAKTGHRIVSRVSGFDQVARAIRHVHSPLHMQGEGHQPLLPSRIIALADLYDRLSCKTDQPTKLQHRAAVEAIKKARGLTLDPDVVDAAIAMFEEDGKRTATQSEIQISASNIREGMILGRPIENQDGILLLKEGSELTERMIEQIRKLATGGTLLEGVWVFGDSDEPSPKTPDHHEQVTIQPAPTSSPSRSKPVDSADRTPTPTLESRPTPIKPVGNIPRPATPKTYQCEVLVIDDSLLVCRAIRRELRLAGINATIATSGSYAIQIADIQEFDVAIVDLQMPDISGEELVRQLASKHPKLNCIILSGNATRDSVVNMAQARNVVAFLTKPWTTERLVETIVKAQKERRQ